jgi:outer membrane receptor protein involved in Fe transport
MTQQPSSVPGVLCAVIASFASAAHAGQDDHPDDLNTVLVTGTRIAAPDLEAISPVTAITAEELRVTGKVRIEDIVNQLPQAFAAQGSTISNGADGTASVDIRGLGAQRTLTLVNGRRLVPGDPDGGGTADLNQIPLALVKRVDVVTGGASAVYGADAVAGVVNFVIDTDFEGIRFDGSYGFYTHHNDNSVARVVADRGFALPERTVEVGYTRDFTLAAGLGNGQSPGHAVLYASYRDAEEVLQSSYDYSACALASGPAFTCGGSGTTSPARFLTVDTLGFTRDPVTGRPVAPGTLVSDTTIDSDGALRQFQSSDLYNFGPSNYYQRPDRRLALGAFARHDAGENAELYGEAMLMENRSIAQVAPSGSFLSAHDVKCDSPLLSPSQVRTFCTDVGHGSADSTTLLIGRRNVEGSARQDHIEHDSYRIVAGVRGNLGSSWRYDAYTHHGVSARESTSLNDFSITRTRRSLNVALDGEGTLRCVSFLDGTDTSCVPWNIFALGAVTPEAVDYLQVPGHITAHARQQVAHVDMTGHAPDWMKLATATSALTLNAGAEYRRERTDFRPDAALSTGDLAGQGGPRMRVTGEFEVAEAFVEGRLPLVEEKRGAEALLLEAGYRRSHYDLGFETDTYRFGLAYAPIETLRLRGSFQHGVRAPDIAELFRPRSIALTGLDDPCDGISGTNTAPVATLEQCMSTGMTPAQYGRVPANPAGQYNALHGGDRFLRPEKSDTVALGFVWRPAFANLSIAADHFTIDVEDTIGPSMSGLAATYLNRCAATGDAQFCDLIHRDSFGSLWLSPDGFIAQTARNGGRLGTSGIDVQANYALNVADHRLSFSVVGTRLDSLRSEPAAGLGSYDCAGLYGAICGVPAPQWRHLLRANWRTPWRGLDLTTTWRYFDAVSVDRSSSDPQLIRDVNGDGVPDVPATDARFSARSYVDLTGAVTFAEDYTFRIGINNLTDKDPPLVGQASCPSGPCNGNTFSQVYDPLGRQWFAFVTMEF